MGVRKRNLSRLLRCQHKTEFLLRPPGSGLERTGYRSERPARSGEASSHSRAKAIRALHSLPPLKSNDPYLDYIQSEFDGSVSYIKELKTSLTLIESVRSTLMTSGNTNGDPSLSAQATLQLSNAVIRNMTLLQVSSRTSGANESDSNQSYLPEIINLAKNLKAATENALAHPSSIEAEDIRLRSLQAYDEKMLSLNQSGFANLSRQLENIKAADAQFEASHPSTNLQLHKLLEDYGKRLDEVTKWKNDTIKLKLIERLAIDLYTEGSYLTINEALWKKQPLSSDLLVFETTLNEALRRLPSYQGVVYRKAHLNDAQLVSYQPGAQITNYGYTSTSTDDGFVSSAPIHFIITSKAGRKIANFSFHYAENEVLFLPDTRFEVTARQTRADGSLEIAMEEI